MDRKEVAHIDPANTSILAALSLPSSRQNLEVPNLEAELPQWICEVYEFQTEIEQLNSSRDRSEAYRPIEREPDSIDWIKRDNKIKPSDRSHSNHVQSTLRYRRSKYAMSRPVSAVQQQRHAIQLMSNLLCIRTNASPFTLVLDDLNQRAMPFLHEMINRGLSRKVNVVVVSFEATRFHPAVRHVQAWGNRSATDILKDIQKAMSDHKESLVIVDNMYDAVVSKNIDIAAFFDLVVMKHGSTLVGVYHNDMIPEATASGSNAYAPDPLQLLKFMATTIITCQSLSHVLAAKAARERSLPEPTFGLLSGAEGIVQCLNANDQRGIVLQAEFRRKSGRPETQTYFLRPASITDYHAPLPNQVIGTLKQEFVTLLAQHPAYASKEIAGLVSAAGNEMETSFNLNLTDKQKAAREGVILPYFDAQKGEGGEGGRILYDMGEEDDFDEEEDEI